MVLVRFDIENANFYTSPIDSMASWPKVLFIVVMNSKHSGELFENKQKCDGIPVNKGRR